MVVRIVRKDSPSEKAYTILDAMQELVAGKIGLLLIVRKKDGATFKVKDFNLKTGVEKLIAPDGLELKPRISARECALYYPLWRD